MTKQGKVYLIGAGPGDPGLLSIKAMECLQTADAVVYDRLADPRILAYAKDDAEMVYVGKASANHTMRQPDINKLLVKLAAEGKTVARLKGGDPFVFGRGGDKSGFPQNRPVQSAVSFGRAFELSKHLLLMPSVVVNFVAR